MYKFETKIENAKVTFESDTLWKLVSAMTEINIIFEDLKQFYSLIENINYKNHTRGRYLIFNEGSLIISLTSMNDSFILSRITNGFMISRIFDN